MDNPLAANTTIGTATPRVDGRLKVTGAAIYGADTIVPNPVHAVLVTSAIARGRISAIDERASRSVPGVLEILSHRNIGSDVKVGKFFGQGGYVGSTILPLGSDRVAHGGQIVAIVLAESLEAAQEAASRLAIDYAEEPPAAGFDSPGAETVAAHVASKQHEDPAVGDAAGVFAAAPVKIDTSYATPTQH